MFRLLGNQDEDRPDLTADYQTAQPPTSKK
jgi:hypothetical protein